MSLWANSRIFLVDKDAYYRRLTVQMLRERSPGGLADSGGGPDDNDLLARFNPTIVILGITEEDQSALDIVRWLRTPDVTPAPGVAIILMSMGISDKTVKSGIFAGVDYFVAKPTSPSVLQQRIENLALNPLPQYTTKTYTGPDRRRLPGDVYEGPNRRQQPGVEGENV